MKNIQDIEKLSAADLERIGADESIPVPELDVRLPRRRAAAWGIAAGVAVLIGAGAIGLLRPPEPKDTFSDPYLAYAAVEQAFQKMGGAVAQSARTINEQANIEKLTYWK